MLHEFFIFLRNYDVVRSFKCCGSLIVGSENVTEDCLIVGSENDSEDCLIETEVTLNGSGATKKRKICYTPIKCYLCDVMDNPKRMTSLAGSSKNRFREVAHIFKHNDEHDDIIGMSKIYKGHCSKVEKYSQCSFLLQACSLVRDQKYVPNTLLEKISFHRCVMD